MATRAEKAATAAAHAKALRPVIQNLATNGITSLSGIARALNNGGHFAIRGGFWTPSQVNVLLQRLGLRE